MFNLFDVTRSIEAPLSSKPRQANDREVSAYAQWLRQRRGLPDMGRTELHFTENRQGRRYEHGHCIGATFGDYTSNANRREYEPGAYSIIMPGHDMHRAAVTFETLDDSGEVERSQTLPAEPKRGGVIWSREDVRKAHGPVAKPGKVKRGKVETDPIPVHAEPVAVEAPEFAAPAVAESEEAPIAAQESGEALNALSGPEIAPEEDALDPVADLAERVAALEARLEALSAEAGAGAEISTTPSGEVAQPKRTAAHERAVRRAWTERKARRGAQGGMAIHARRIEALELQLRLAQNEQALDKQAVEEAYARAEQFARRGNQHAARRRASAQRARRMLAESRAQAAHYYANWKEEARREASQGRKRADSVTRARRMIATSRKAATFQRQRADVLAAQLDKLRADMADPIQPERASDIARLVRERDEARNAAAATSARNASLQAALNSLGDKLEEMAVRVTLAERAARVAPPIAV